LRKTSTPTPPYARAGVVDETQLFGLKTFALKIGQEPHPFSNVVAQTPEVDDVAPGTQARRMFYQSGPETGFEQPVGKRRPCDAGA
jgi:hypothetical protein